MARDILEFGGTKQEVIQTRTQLQLMYCTTLMYAELSKYFRAEVPGPRD